MRRLAVSIGLGFLLLACTPSPNKVCTHFDELDRQDPVPKYGDLTPKRDRPSKLTACQKTLVALKEVDSAAYSSVAKCITKATASKDAWNCWVLGHVSEKQPEKKKRRIACNEACGGSKDQCEPACNDKEECLVNCHMRYEDCITTCEFN